AVVPLVAGPGLRDVAVDGAAEDGALGPGVGADGVGDRVGRVLVPDGAPQVPGAPVVVRPDALGLVAGEREGDRRGRGNGRPGAEEPAEKHGSGGSDPDEWSLAPARAMERCVPHGGRLLRQASRAAPLAPARSMRTHAGCASWCGRVTSSGKGCGISDG